MVVLLVRAGAVDPVELVAHEDDLELLQQHRELARVGNEAEDVRLGFGRPVFDQVLEELLVGEDDVGGGFVADEVDGPILVRVPLHRVLNLHVVVERLELREASVLQASRGIDVKELTGDFGGESVLEGDPRQDRFHVAAGTDVDVNGVRLLLLGEQNVDGGVGQRAPLNVKGMDDAALAGLRCRRRLQVLIVVGEEELVQMVALAVRPRAVTDVAVPLATLDVDAPNGRCRFHHIAVCQRDQHGLLRHDARLVHVEVKVEEVRHHHHKSFAHEARRFVRHSDVLRTRRQQHLRVLHLRLHEVHEVVQRVHRRPRAVHAVRFLQANRQRGGREAVAEREPTRRDVQLDHRDEIAPRPCVHRLRPLLLQVDRFADLLVLQVQRLLLELRQLLGRHRLRRNQHRRLQSESLLHLRVHLRAVVDVKLEAVQHN